MAANWTIVMMDRVLVKGDRSDVVTGIHYEVTDSETVGNETLGGRVYRTVG